MATVAPALDEDHVVHDKEDSGRLPLPRKRAVLVPLPSQKHHKSNHAFGRAGYFGDQIFHAPGAELWHLATGLHTASVACPLRGSALTDTTENQSEICPLNLRTFACFCTIDHTLSHKDRLIPQ